MKPTLIWFGFVFTTGISMSTQTDDWVQSAIQELRRSDEYKHTVIDEWYETLPVAQWSDVGSGVVVRFGRNSMKTRSDSGTPVRIASPPHLECTIAYPSAAMKWMQVNSAAVPSALSGGGTGKAGQRGNVMASRRSYYQALSAMLDAQSLLKKTAQITPQDCALVTIAQTRLYEAADSNLLSYYESASAPVRSWIAAHCPGTP